MRSKRHLTKTLVKFEIGHERRSTMSAAAARSSVSSTIVALRFLFSRRSFLRVLLRSLLCSSDVTRASVILFSDRFALSKRSSVGFSSIFSLLSSDTYTVLHAKPSEARPGVGFETLLFHSYHLSSSKITNRIHLSTHEYRTSRSQSLTYLTFQHVRFTRNLCYHKYCELLPHIFTLIVTSNR